MGIRSFLKPILNCAQCERVQCVMCMAYCIVSLENCIHFVLPFASLNHCIFHTAVYNEIMKRNFCLATATHLARGRKSEKRYHYTKLIVTFPEANLHMAYLIRKNIFMRTPSVSICVLHFLSMSRFRS